MANPEHIEIVKNGFYELLTWRAQNSDVMLDLSDANLRGVDLTGGGIVVRVAGLGPINLERADLSDTDLAKVGLRGAKLRNAILDRSNLKRADLCKADLSGASLHYADLDGAELFGCDLSHSRLTGANLSRAHFTSTNLEGAVLGACTLANVGFKGCSGMATIRHEQPSSISLDTIIRSYHELPPIFLRGCGVPEPFIANLKALIGAMEPIQFYSCFISYSIEDQQFANRLHADLQAKGIRTWFAPQDMRSGRKIHEQIDEAIHVHDKLLLVLSTHSMQSEWVKTEMATARDREEREMRKVLFPIAMVPFSNIQNWKCFDADRGKDSAREIREYFLPDFSDWKNHDSYQNALERLMRDLQTSSDPILG